jgi:transcriptional regulator with XRE-family HTH domain
MTGKQLQRLLDDAGLSQRGAAKAIGISERQMRRYIAGDAAVPKFIEYALRWVALMTDLDGKKPDVDGNRR